MKAGILKEEKRKDSGKMVSVLNGLMKTKLNRFYEMCLTTEHSLDLIKAHISVTTLQPLNHQKGSKANLIVLLKI